MKLLSAASFYRKASTPNASIEDGFFINLHADIYGVTDGNSAAFSPKNPPLLYNGLTGAQMANWVVNTHLSRLTQPTYLKEFLLEANCGVLSQHQNRKKNPIEGDDVGGACFTFCQPSQGGLTFLLGGDSFALVETKTGPLFLTGFDKAAFYIEERDQQKFTELKAETGGNIGAAWDLYWSHYKAKRIFCKNRNIGRGGDASLNGDPALEQCWKEVIIPWDDEPWSVLLGTDGLLPPTEVHPDKFQFLSKLLFQLYVKGGVLEILAWRDLIEREKASLTHIQGWPESVAVELKFG